MRSHVPTARAVRREDLPDLLELYGMLHVEESYDPADPELRETFEAMLADDAETIVGVEADGRLVATCVVSITRNLTHGARPWAVMENVVTHEAYRGQGYGKQAVEYGCEVAREAGCYKVMLLTGREAESVLGFYEACDFDREEKTGFVRYL